MGASDMLLLSSNMREISLRQSRLSTIQSTRSDIMNQLANFATQYGKDSAQYKILETQITAKDAELQVEQNLCEVKIQDLKAWNEALRDKMEEDRDIYKQ